MSVIQSTLFVLATAAIMTLASAPVSAQNNDQPGTPLTKWELDSAKQDGVWAGESAMQKRPSMRYERGTDGKMWIYTGQGTDSGWTRADTLAPHEEGKSAEVNAMAEHADDKDLKGMRREVIKHDEKAGQDDSASGHAEVVMNNTAANRAYTKDDVRNGEIMAASAPILREASRNRLLGEAFADCEDKTVAYEEEVVVHPTWTESCSTVRLRLEPGYQGTLTRTVSTDDNTSQGSIETPIDVPAGETLTVEGTVVAEFPEGTFVMDSFTAGVGPLMVTRYFTTTVTEQPTFFNDWHYTVDVAREAESVLPTGASLYISYSYKGVPEYTFGSECTDGDCAATGDEFCKAIWTCDAVAPVVVDGKLIPMDVVLEKGGPLYPVDPADDPGGTRAAQSLICMKAHVDIDCARIYTPPGETDQGPPNTCAALNAKADCYLMPGAGSCAVGGFSELRQWCYIQTKTYSCHSNDVIRRVKTFPRSDCGSAALSSCLSGECQSYNRRPKEIDVHEELAKQVIYQHFTSDWLTQDQEREQNEKDRNRYGAHP